MTSAGHTTAPDHIPAHKEHGFLAFKDIQKDIHDDISRQKENPISRCLRMSSEIFENRPILITDLVENLGRVTIY
jgi:hypothetical protein